MFTVILRATEITEDQFWTGATVIGGIILLSHLVTKYTKYEGESNYDAGGSDFDDDIDLDWFLFF